VWPFGCEPFCPAMAILGIGGACFNITRSFRNVHIFPPFVPIFSSPKPFEEQVYSTMEEQDRNTAQGAWSLAIGDQIQTTAQKVHQIFYPSLSSDPGNDSTVPLLSSSHHGHDAMDAQQKDQRSSGTGSTVMALLKLLLVMAPLFTVLSSWAILLGAGLDPLAFGMLAFYLVMTLCGVIMLVCLSAAFLSIISFLFFQLILSSHRNSII
jgi:hypothetical protein